MNCNPRLKFQVYRNTTAVIPAKVGTYGKRSCLEVHFHAAEFQPIEEGKRKKAKKAAAAPEAGAAQAKEQAAPGLEPAKPAEVPPDKTP